MNNETKDKPREFWVIPEDNVDIGSCYDRSFEGTIHVIEYSAVESLQKEKARLREALEFYANDDHWNDRKLVDGKVWSKEKMGYIGVYHGDKEPTYVARSALENKNG